jgi:hypothetical protein
VDFWKKQGRGAPWVDHEAEVWQTGDMLACLGLLLVGVQVTSSGLEEACTRLADAFRAYNEERWWPAERAFEEALRRMDGLPELREYAVLYRGHSLARAGERVEAMHVFEGLARTATDPRRAALALEAFVAAGGDLSIFLPPRTMEQAAREWWPGFVGAPNAVWDPALLAGDLAATHRLLGQEALRAALGVPTDAVWEMSGAGHKDLRAWIMAQANGARWMLEAEAVGAEWRFVAVRILPSFSVQARAPESPALTAARLSAAPNLRRLRAIGFALAAWRSDVAPANPTTLPARPHDLPGLAPADLLWNSPDDGVARDWLVCKAPASGIPNPIWLAAPQPVNGFREVLFSAGSDAVLEEPDFISQARAQGWILPGVVQMEDIDESLALRIQDVIKRAATGDRHTRREAEEELRRIGPPIFPFMQTLLKSDDPELRSLAEKLYHPEP